MSAVVFLSLFFLSSVHAALPKGWKTCRKSAPDFETCLAKELTNAVHSLVEGDKELKALPLDPLKFEKITVPATNGPVSVDLAFYNGSIHGLKDLTIHNFKTDWKTGEALGHLPIFTVLSTYRLNGKVLVLPIEGEGDCNITYVDSGHEGKFKFKRETIDGVEHLMIEEYRVHLHPKRVYMHFGNLFNGNKELGDKTNEFLNQNWRVILQEISSVIDQPFADMFAMIGNSILKQIPATEIEVP